MKPVFMRLFGDAAGVFKEFEVPVEEQKGVKILFAYYGYEDYSGDAWVLFKKGHKLFEVSGGHCSCNGLEGQWKPSPVTIKELAMRLVSTNLGRNYNGLEYGLDENGVHGIVKKGDNEYADELEATLKLLNRKKAKAKKAKKAAQRNVG